MENTTKVMGSPNRIVEAGLAEQNPVLPRVGAAETTSSVQEERTPFLFDEARERVAALVSRVVRDRVFRRVVLRELLPVPWTPR